MAYGDNRINFHEVLGGLKAENPGRYLGLALSARYFGQTPTDGWRHVIHRQRANEAALAYADSNIPLIELLELGGE